MARMTIEYAERLRAHCSKEDLGRWKGAAARAGARNFSSWVRWVLDKESALVDAAARNPWVDRGTGRAKQQQMELAGRRQVVGRGFAIAPRGQPNGRAERERLAAESDGLL